VSIALWIVSGILALAFLFAGGTKLSQPKDQLAQRGMTYVEDLSANQVKLIGLAEVLGALGLILPRATGIAEVLTPLAAVGLAIIQAGAIVVHVRRKEPKVVPANIFLLALALFVAVGRFVAG
jgi:uncharacterized membrane protein